ncbi:hypothetical protein, partial [Methanosarcina mazei]|uniref:hypothetical protein n=1 Tax=Methanosarcina mazei TaxID=2209 RepID=UPI001F2D296C
YYSGAQESAVNYTLNSYILFIEPPVLQKSFILRKIISAVFFLSILHYSPRLRDKLVREIILKSQIRSQKVKLYLKISNDTQKSDG